MRYDRLLDMQAAGREQTNNMDVARKKDKPKAVLKGTVKLGTRKSLPARAAQDSIPTPASNAPSVDDDGVTLISEQGDVVLAVEHEQDQVHKASFRVDGSRIRNASPYFQLLLDPARFEEGHRVATRLLDLKDRDLASIPTSQLPVVSIQDIGRISPVKSITLLLTDFLCLLHARPLANPHPPLSNLANLTVVADRFDCLPSLRSYVHSNRLFTLLDAKSPKSKSPVTEERLRQRCFISLHLHYPPWFLTSTQRLIQRTSFLIPPDTAPAWQDLPASLEEELFFRRCALLDTVQSLQAYFLSKYTSRTRQCRLGYDSSAACDSFQLGETVKFFSRAGTLALTSPLVPSVYTSNTEQSNARRDDVEEDQGYEGDLLDLVEKLRMCPEYQVDSNHHHCGIRTRLIPLLDLVEKAIEDVGVCAECWKDWRGEYAWREAKRPLVWKRDERGSAMGGLDPARRCLNRHVGVRDMCLARERVWERPREEGGHEAGWMTSRK